MKALAGFVGSVPGQDHPIKLQDLLLEAEQLSAERGKTRTGNLGHPLVARVGNNMQQFGHSFAPDRGDNAKLGEMRSDRINHRGLLADEQMARAVKHQAALLLRRLGRYETHVGSGDCLADSLCVSHVVLLPFNIRFDVSRRHQPNGMAERLKFARPMVRRCASLYANQAWWQLSEAATMPGWHRGLRIVSPLVARTSCARPYRSADAAGLRQTLC